MLGLSQVSHTKLALFQGSRTKKKGFQKRIIGVILSGTVVLVQGSQL